MCLVEFLWWCLHRFVHTLWSQDDTEASIQKQLDLAQRLMQQQQHPHQPQASKPRALPTSAQHSRKVQDSKRAEHDTFHSAIVNLKLDPVDGSQPAKQSQEEKELPSSFESHQKYVQLFSPLVLEEIRAELQAARAEAEEARVGELVMFARWLGLVLFSRLVLAASIRCGTAEHAVVSLTHLLNFRLAS